VNGVDLFHLDGAGNFVEYTGNAGNTSRISARPSATAPRRARAQPRRIGIHER